MIGLTEKTLAAYCVGNAVQMLHWSVFKNDYGRIHHDLIEGSRILGADVTLPSAFTEPNQAEIIEPLFFGFVNHLTNERKKLGGDVYALPFFHLGYLLIGLVVQASFRSEDEQAYLEVFQAVLADLGIKSEYKRIKDLLHLETQWLNDVANIEGGEIPGPDVIKVVQRLMTRVMVLWDRAQRSSAPLAIDREIYHSVFISYSSTDEEFCLRLYRALKAEGVRVWFAPHDMVSGKKLHIQIGRAIGKHDKLLVVLSNASMNSEWVKTEIYKARAREMEQRIQVLFPIRLVPFEDIKLKFL